MYQQLISYLGSVPFFNTAAFGILSLSFIGASWCLVGAIAGKAPKHNIKMEYLLFLGGLGAMAVCALFMLLSGKIDSGTPKIALYLTLLAFFLDGLMCYVQHTGVSRAMQNGPNGVIWALTQSAMVFPFIVGILFYGVELTAMRLAGIIFMLLSLVLFGGAKDDPETSRGPWKLVTFIVLVAVAIGQTVTNLPFYYEETKGISNSLCILVMMAGYVIPAFFQIVLDKENKFAPTMKHILTSKIIWIYSALLLPVAAFFAFTIQLPGMRAMSAHGLGGMCFPLMVGSCIATFSIYSALVLKEKMKKIELIALIFCIAGLICLCVVNK